MQKNLNQLIGFKMGATDGEIGEVKEFYFDDTNWNIRYLIVETGNWLYNKKVLIAPQALLAPDWDNKVFPINLTKEQIKNSPDIDTDKPISLSKEMEMYGHYEWQPYMGAGFFAGGSGALMNLNPVIDEELIKMNDPDHKDFDPNLRSTARISGYYIHATDGDIGHVKDFIMDIETWKITYLVIDTHNWFGGKKVQISVRHVTEIQWENFSIIMDISKEYLKDCQAYQESRFVFPQNFLEL